MKLFRIAKLNLLHWHRNHQYAVVLLYLIFYGFNRFRGLAYYASDLGVKITPWVFPFLPCMGASFLPFMLGYMLWIADAPFRTKQQGLVILRTGKRLWLAGQLVYLLIVSVFFTVLLWIISWLWLLPEVTWSREWGAVLSTTAMNGVPGEYGVYMQFPYTVMKNMDPLCVTLWCATAMIAICFLLGVITTACNLWLRKGCGATFMATIAAISVIPNLRAINPGPIKLVLWISPLNWMDYSLMGHPEQYLPTHGFAIWGPAVLGLGLSALLLLTIGKCNIETDKE